MAAVSARSAGQARRWASTPPSERKANVRAARAARSERDRQIRIEAAIARLAADAPPLTGAQRDRLRAILANPGRT